LLAHYTKGTIIILKIFNCFYIYLFYFYFTPFTVYLFQLSLTVLFLYFSYFIFSFRKWFSCIQTIIIIYCFTLLYSFDSLAFWTFTQLPSVFFYYDSYSHHKLINLINFAPNYLQYLYWFTFPTANMSIHFAWVPKILFMLLQ